MFELSQNEKANRPKLYLDFSGAILYGFFGLQGL